MDDEGYIMKRSIIGSIECFERHARQNNFDGQSQSIKFKELNNSQLKMGGQADLPNNKNPVTIEYYGIRQIQKEQERERRGLPKHESTFMRKKSKIEELKRQSLQTMHKRGARG